MRGMTRALDNLGRIVIPKEIRTAYHIEPEDLMQIEVVSNGILLKPAKTTCVVCGSSKGILTAGDVGICRRCAAKLAELAKEKEPEAVNDGPDL